MKASFITPKSPKGDFSPSLVGEGHFQLSIILPVFYGLSVFLFFWKIFPYHLHFQEQFQLFLFTQDYFIETFSRPGGFSNYAGRFFTQFFVSSFAGALLISCFLTGIQQLVYAIVRRFRRGEYYSPVHRSKGEYHSPIHSAGLFLSFLPSLFYWYLLCDEISQTGGVIALLLVLIVTLVGIFPKLHSTRRIYLFVSIPILYWLAGGAVILSVLLLIFYEWRHSTTHNVFTNLTISIAAIVFAISLPFIAKHFLVQYPLERYWWGVDYVYFTTYSPLMISYLWILILLIVVGVSFLPVIKKIPTPIIWSIQILALLFCIYFVILKSAYSQNLSKEEIMAYDYHCRMQHWDEVIKMANHKSPTIPMTVACLNLALYKTGQLPDKMFNYYQNGPEGLLPTFRRDFMIPMVGGEPYYYLGFVNTAQRFAFEAMEAFPDYQKSARVIKRLAETNLINGYYEAASKYLYILEKTLFYRKWAEETRTYLYNEAKINAHPEWGEIRRFQTDQDFLFSTKEKDMMLGIFFQQHPDNRMAYEYLMAYALLTKDINDFPLFFRLKKDFTYKEIPKSWQEALIYIWGLNHNDLDSIPVPVSNAVKQQAIAYANTYTSTQSPEPMLRKNFSKTYWYYLHFRDYNHSDTEHNVLQY